MISSIKDKVKHESWIHNDLFLKDSEIDGIGIFTRTRLSAGTTIIVWGGMLFTSDDVASGKAKQHTIVAIDDGLWLGSPPEAPRTIDDYMNHSCLPNVWLKDAITLDTRIDVEADSELVADYAIWLDNPDYVMKRNCNCCTPVCRRRITGRDWMLPQVIELNRGHFAPFLNRRIIELGL